MRENITYVLIALTIAGGLVAASVASVFADTNTFHYSSDVKFRIAWTVQTNLLSDVEDLPDITYENISKEKVEKVALMATIYTTGEKGDSQYDFGGVEKLTNQAGHLSCWGLRTSMRLASFGEGISGTGTVAVALYHVTSTNVGPTECKERVYLSNVLTNKLIMPRSRW